MKYILFFVICLQINIPSFSVQIKLKYLFVWSFILLLIGHDQYSQMDTTYLKISRYSSCLEKHAEIDWILMDSDLVWCIKKRHLLKKWFPKPIHLTCRQRWIKSTQNCAFIRQVAISETMREIAGKKELWIKNVTTIAHEIVISVIHVSWLVL